MHASSRGIWSAIPNSNQLPTLDPVESGPVKIQSISNPTKFNRSNLLDPSSKYSSRNQTHKDLVTGYTQLVVDRIQNGWSCHLLTILFSQLPGQREMITNQMKDEIQRIYSSFVTRVHRNPRNVSAHELPLLIGSADLPVHKRNPTNAPMVLCNGGLHCHALLLMPPVTRLRESVQEHFESHNRLYSGPRKLVQKVHVQPVFETPERVVDYVFKTVIKNRLTYDDAVIVLPRARQELAAA